MQRNAAVLDSIELFADLSEGFTIAFMEVNSERDRATTIDHLTHSNRFPGVQWVPIVLSDEGLQYFGLEVREQLQMIEFKPDRQSVLLISGLERSIGVTGDYPQVLSNLNMERDSYPRILPYPIVLLLPSYAITRCARFAPDFWSWKSIEIRLHSELPTPDLSPKANPIVTDPLKLKPVSQSRFDLLAELLAENPTPTIDRARLLNQLGDAYRSVYKNDEAEAAYRSALNIYENFSPSLDYANTLDGLARSYDLQGKFAAALQLWQQALTIQQELGDRRGEASSLHHLSMIYQKLGDLSQALLFSQQSIEIYKEIDNRSGEATSLHQLSIIYQSLGDLSQALQLSQQSIEICKEIGNRQGEAVSLHQLSTIYQLLGNLSLALQLSRQSIKIYKEIGNRQGEAASLHVLSMIYKALGDLSQALHFSQDSLKIQREIGNRQGEAASLHQLSMIYEILGDLSQALQCSQQSIKIQREIGNRQGEAASLHQLSIIYQSLGDLSQALQLSQQSIKIDREIGNRQGEATSLAQMAAIAHKQSDSVQAKELLLQAAEVLGSIGDYGSLITVLDNLDVIDKTNALKYLSQSIWLTLHCSTNLKSAIILITAIYQKVPSGDSLAALLCAAACHLCQTRTHPEFEQLIELSNKIISHATIQQGIETQVDFDNWAKTNRLNEPEYFLPKLYEQLEAIVGDGWLFDRATFLKEK